MKIELKKIKIAEYLSEETTAFTAEIYVDGVNAGYAKNDGHGGSTDYRYHYDENKTINERNRKLIEDAEQHCLTLPALDLGTFKIPMNLENFIDELLNEHLKDKDNKKFEKKMEKTIMWGVKGGSSYTQVGFKVPLKQVPLIQLQALVNKYKAQFKPNEVFLNTNLESLGVKL